MKTDSHYSIRVVKSLFNAVSVMNVDVKIQDSVIYLKKFKNAKNYIVDITKSTGLAFFGVVIAS